MRLFVAGCLLFACIFLSQLDSNVSAARLTVGSESIEKVSEVTIGEERRETNSEDKQNETLIELPKDEKKGQLLLMRRNLASSRLPAKKQAKCPGNTTEKGKVSCKTHADCLYNGHNNGFTACNKGYKRFCDGQKQHGTTAKCEGTCTDCLFACPDASTETCKKKCPNSVCEGRSECNADGTNIQQGSQTNRCTGCKQ